MIYQKKKCGIRIIEPEMRVAFLRHMIHASSKANRERTTQWVGMLSYKKILVLFFTLTLSITYK